MKQLWMNCLVALSVGVIAVACGNNNNGGGHDAGSSTPPPTGSDAGSGTSPSGRATPESACMAAVSLGCGNPDCLPRTLSVQQMANTAGCSDEFDAYLGCLQDHACSGMSLCGDPLATVDACVYGYCLRHPDESFCGDT